MKQTQNQFYGKRSEMPNKLPPGSTYICSDEDSLYHAREDGIPITFDKGNVLSESNVKTLSHFVYNPQTNKLEADRAIETTLNSLFLGEQHKMSSGAENIYFTNLTSSINWYPVWGGLKDQSLIANQQPGSGVYNPTGRVFSDFGTLSLGGSPVINTAIPYDGDNFFSINISGVGITTRVAEVVPPGQKLKYELSVNGTAVYTQFLEHDGLSINEDLTWYFDHPLDVLAGSTNHASITKVDDNENSLGLLLVCEGDDGTNRYQTNVLNRLFDDKDIAFKSDLDTLVAGSTYKGTYDDSASLPSLPTGSDSLGDFYRVNVAGSNYDVGDILIFNGTDYDLIPVESITQTDLLTSSIKVYDAYVKAGYVGSVSDGSILYPYSDINTAVNAANDGDTIYLDGVFNINSEIVLPSNKSLTFIGANNTNIQYTSYNTSNGNIISYEGNNTEEFNFEHITFKNAGGYALLIKKTEEVNIRNCEFYNNGWDGTVLHTVLDSVTSGILGYDSTQAELQAFYAGSHASNGGAVRLQECRKPLIRECRAERNLRGFRVQDCGINGGGFMIENQSIGNIESGIYLAAGSLGGCQNITVAINYSAYNANNGLLAIGGINNKFSQNEVYGNWNAGLCGWGIANLTLRDSGLYNNNRSRYNGIGNVGDAKASIQINDIYSFTATQLTYNPDTRFIAEILDTQVHYTGLGSNTDKVGFLITSGMGLLPDNPKNIIKIDDVGFIGQDYAIDLSEVDVTNLRLSLGDNSYQSIGQKAVKAPLAGNYSELPFSNHVMEVPSVDVVVDTLKQTIALHEGVGGNVINVYNMNELQSVLKTNSIDIIQRSSDKIQLRDCTFGNIYINSIVAGNNLNSANDSLNAAFNMDLTQYKDFLVSEVGINGDASSGGSLPAQVDNWYIAYGNRATEQITSAGIVLDVKNEQPFYNGNFLEKGHEYVWSHYDNADYMIGVWSGAEEKKSPQDAMNLINWEVGFFFDENNDNFNPNFSSGCDLASRYSTGYAMNSNKVLALRYGNDNYLYLLDITGGSETIIAKSNLALIGDSQTIFFAGENQPNAQFPVMQERTERWTIVADYDDSENGEWINGIENQTAIKSNMSISPGEKFVWTLPAVGINRSYGIGYIGNATGQGNVVEDFTARWRWDAQELIHYASANGWTFNTENSYYDSINNRWNLTTGQPVQVSYRHTDSNVLKMFDETHGELIMTLDASTNGTPIHLYFGANAYASDLSQIPLLSKYNMVNDGDDINSVTGWYYIESPDGQFYYPLFATEEEANYIDSVEGGNETSHIHTFIDDTYNGGSNTWYMPTTNSVHSGTQAPQHGIYGNSTNVLWNEIPTGDDSNYSPTFNDLTFTVAEQSAVNLVYKPAGDTDTYNVTNIPTGYADTGYAIVGTAETITDGLDIVHTLNVTKANAFGSDTGTITFTVTDDPSNNASPNATNWTKALHFGSGGGYSAASHLVQVHYNQDFNVLRHNGTSTTATLPDQAGMMSRSVSARPWATSVVFKSDGNNVNQHIWQQGNGSGGNGNHIYLRLNSIGKLYFGWGKTGVGVNECLIATNISSSTWYGVYIASNGARLAGGTNQYASPAQAADVNLAASFDIRLMSSADSFSNVGSNLSTASNWVSTGIATSESTGGGFYIGGASGQKYFYGKVASMVVTALRITEYANTQIPMPSDAEIKKMIADPKGWEDDYRDGELVRSYNGVTTGTYTPNDYVYGYISNMIYLMGDGTNDSFGNGIRNQVRPNEQNIVKMQLNNMISSDIVNVTIPGLS